MKNILPIKSAGFEDALKKDQLCGREPQHVKLDHPLKGPKKIHEQTPCTVYACMGIAIRIHVHVIYRTTPKNYSSTL